MLVGRSIVLDGLDEREVIGFGRTERKMLYRGAFIDAVADAGAEREGFGLGLECFGFAEHESIVGVKVFLESIEVVVLDKTYKNGVVYDVDSYWHKEQILMLFSKHKITKNP